MGKTKYNQEEINLIEENIGLIKEMIKNSDIKMSDVAGTLKITPRNLYRWVNKEHLPNRVYFDKIVEIGNFAKRNLHKIYYKKFVKN